MTKVMGMLMKMNKNKCDIVKANKFSHAKTGYFVFVHSPKAVYGISKHKYFKTKKKAVNFCKRLRRKR